MRTEKEMFDIIINTAKSDDRVLAAYLKGSRANPSVSVQGATRSKPRNFGDFLCYP